MPSSRIALLIEPGSTPSSVMTTLDMINIARRYPQAGDCQVDLLSSMGGAIGLAAAVRVETQAMPASLARYAAVILARDWRYPCSSPNGLRSATHVCLSRSESESPL